MEDLVFVLATDAPRTLPPSAPHAMVLWGILALLGLILIVALVVAMSIRQGQQIARGARNRRSPQTVDPWAEAGRRMPTPQLEQDDIDTRDDRE